jgi:hypothetical protein
MPALSVIDLAESRDDPFVDGATGNLVGGVPLVVIRQTEERKPRRGCAPGIAGQAAHFPGPLGNPPRAIVRFAFAAHEQHAAANRARVAERKPPKAILSCGHARERPIEAGEEMKLRAAGAPEISDLRVVHAELVIHEVDELRNEEIEIGVALPVAMRREIERHSVQPRLEVGSVVEVEAAHEVLVRLAVARMLRHDHPRHRLQQLAFARDRAEPELGGADAARRGAHRHAAKVVAAAHHFDGVERQPARGVRLRRGLPGLRGRAGGDGRTE